MQKNSQYYNTETNESTIHGSQITYILVALKIKTRRQNKNKKLC